ncbi:hypothetical protein G6F64_003669 [Rhizopus arrhizus]|uniref:Arf-GAP domain-containing protein n=1 Tax=Rhizopus oryzae TaxID=64495 RepID=A0A9P6XE00_RHIOR|nr:hypothetical protein G6F64_003669 [Rhizopus arrhizus]
MSTRLERLADKAANEKHTKILIDLLQQPYNRNCADCKRKDPRWASWNLGIFVCIRCSGIHRSLGTHISKVKSVDLDTWVPEQIENMIQWGNQRANAYWEESLGDQQIPDGSMDKWIKAKYEQKKWVKNEEVPNPSDIKITENQPNETEKIQKVIKCNDNSVELGHHHHYTDPTIECKSIETGQDKVSNHETATIKTTNDSKNNSPYKIDMASFQQQLSMLAVGRPSTGLIPKAPEGSDKSWANFVIPSRK